MSIFGTEAARERATVAIALIALGLSFVALVFSGLQWHSSEKAVHVAEQARQDAVKEADRQRVDATSTLDQQRADAAAALKAQADRADRANQLTESLAASNKRSVAILEQTFAVNRPIVLINHVDTKLLPERKGFLYEATLINDGLIAALNYVGGCEHFLGGVQIGASDPASKPITLGSHDIIEICQAHITGEHFDLIQSGKATLDLYIHATYEGPVAKYQYCDHQQYSSQTFGFINLGEGCDASKPFPQ